MEQVKHMHLIRAFFIFMVVATAALIGLDTSRLQRRNKDTTCRLAYPDL